LTLTGGQLIEATGADTVQAIPLSTFGKARLNDANATAARSALGLTDPILDKGSPGVIGLDTQSAAFFAALQASSLDVNGSTDLQDTTIATGSTYGAASLVIDQADNDKPFIKFDGVSGSPASGNATNTNGDGAVVGPREPVETDGWAFSLMIRVETHAGVVWIPTFTPAQ
jgi:hypothetical protein